MLTRGRSVLTMGLVLLAALALAGMGCKKDGGEGGAGGGGGGGAAPAKPSLEIETQTFAYGGFSIEIAVPKGWQAQDFGSNAKLFWGPGSGMYKSQLRFGTTCQGDCRNVAANIAGQAAKQVEMHGSSFDDIQVTEDAAVEGGGHAFLLSMKRRGAPAYHYELYRFQEGWEEAVLCSALLLNDEAALLDDFKKICREMKVAPAPSDG